jgi:hypothetical protein
MTPHVELLVDAVAVVDHGPVPGARAHLDGSLISAVSEHAGRTDLPLRRCGATLRDVPEKREA